MDTKTRLPLLSLALAAGLAACDDGEDLMSAAACLPSAPDAYDGAGFEANAAAELALRAQFTAFLKPMRDAAADLDLKPRASELKALYEAGTPSLRALTSPYFAPRVDGYLEDFEAAAGRTWKPQEPPPATGGKFGNDIYRADGLDIRQAIEKGLFAAAFYNRAVALSREQVTPATVDRLLALYGAHPSFPLSDSAMVTPTPDVWIAQYAKRRTRKDTPTPGLYHQIRADLVAARAAAAGGARCTGALGRALKSFRENMERVLLATVVYYAFDAKAKLTKNHPTDADVSGGLHSIGEAASFVHGFRMLPAGERIITDAQVDELLGLLLTPATGPVAAYRFATDTAGQIGRLDEVVGQVRQIYGFTADEVDQFRTNH